MGTGTSSGKTAAAGAAGGGGLQGQTFNTKASLESGLKANGFRIVDKETDTNSPGVSYSGAYWVTRNDNPDEDYMVDIKVEQDKSVTVVRLRKA